MSHAAITVERLSKAYRLGVKENAPDTLASALAGIVRAPFRNLNNLRRLTRFRDSDDASDTLWALRDVSFEISEGEVVGVIGRNGAGKSTLLKILSRITEPTSGRAMIRGRVSSLLEVGTGFHPELTGRENIYMNGTILGMTKREIDRKFDEIVDFSGVEKFLDTPIKRYSSGMQVRLAFAVAAHLEPEILIIDEVLAVGDLDFQKKCLGKMQNVASSGRTVLFVSHNMGAVDRLCTRGLYLENGSLWINATAKDAVKAYHRSNDDAASAPGHRFQPTNECQSEIRTLKVNEVSVTSNGVVHSEGYSIGAPLEFNVEMNVFEALSHPAVVIRLRTANGQLITELHSRRCDGQMSRYLPGRQTISCVIPEIMLCSGDYQFQVGIAGNGRMVFNAETAGQLTILPTDFFGTGKGPSVAGTIMVCRQRWLRTCNEEFGAGLIEAGSITSAPAQPSRELGR